MKKNVVCVVMIIIAVNCFVACHGTLQTDRCIEWMRGSIDKILSDVDDIRNDGIFDAAYILGGTENSLLLKFQLCAELYRQGRCRNVLVLDRPGFTEYRKSYGRNLTNNEWSMEKLVNLGVSARDVIFVMPEYGFFGTLTEAQTVTRIIIERELERTVLITARHHTKRVRMSFSHFLEGCVNGVCVIGTNEKVSIREIVSEMVKLSLYRFLLLRLADNDLPLKKVEVSTVETYS